MVRSSGGIYSKPDARVKLFPAEHVTYIWHGKPSGRIVDSAGLQERHHRRSVAPPTSLHEVSLVRSAPLIEKPMAQASPVAMCHSPKRHAIAENRRIVSLNCPSPIRKVVLSHPSGISLITNATAPKNRIRTDLREAFARSCSSRFFEKRSCNSSVLHRQAQRSAIPPAGAPVILHLKLHKKHFQPEACWRGKFEVIGELRHSCDGLEAYFPFESFIKVHKQMPEILKLEVIPLSQSWQKMFEVDHPGGQDIGLCFISSLQRPNRKFDHLLENISSHIGLRTDISTTELLTFSSKLLTKDDQTKDGNLYFWGVFRKHLRKKQHRSNNHINNVESSNASLPNGDSRDRPEDIGMNLDLTEGKEIQSKKCEIDMKLDATGPGKMKRNKLVIGKIFDMIRDKQIERVKCGKNSIKLDLTVDKEHRVSKCLAMLKTPDSNAAISNSAPAVSFFTGSCSPNSADSLCGGLVVDSPPGYYFEVPPGVIEAHSGLRTGETAETDIPPGFAKLLEVNEEMEESSEEREFPKTKWLSYENTSTQSTSRICTGVSMPLVDNFQETGEQEKQKHCRKRGQQESSEPFAGSEVVEMKINPDQISFTSLNSVALAASQRVHVISGDVADCEQSNLICTVPIRTTVSQRDLDAGDSGKAPAVDGQVLAES